MSDYTQEALLVLELARVRAENAALAANVERLQQELRRCASLLHCNFPSTDKDKAHRDAVASLKDKPETSLARLKAEAKGELLSTVRELDLTTNNGDIRRDAEWRDGWNQCLRELRRQAEE